MSDFTAQDGRVLMTGNHRPVTLSDWQCDQLLDLFESCGAADLFNRLHEAQRKAMGELFTPRVSSLRGLSLVVNNVPPSETVRAMFVAAVAEIEQ